MAGFAQSRYLRNVNQVIPHNTGHFFVDLQQDDSCLISQRNHLSSGHAAGEIAMLIHRGNLSIKYIQSGHAVSPVAGCCAVVIRYIGIVALLNRFSACAACKPGYIIIFTLECRVHKRIALYGQNRMVLYSCDFAASCSFADSRTDDFGLLQACRTGTDITGFYIHCNLFRRFQFCTVHFLKFVHVCSPFLVSLHDFVKKNRQRIVLFFHFCIQNTFYSLYFSTKKAKK